VAEEAVHARARIAFDAARAAGLPGQFRAFEISGLRALLTSSPGLGFLNSVTGVTEESTSALASVLDVFRRYASGPTLVTGSVSRGLEEQLRSYGFAPTAPRPIAVLDMSRRDKADRTSPRRGSVRVTRVETEEDRALFLQVLLAGYTANANVTGFMGAEHSSPAVQGFLAWQDDRPVAAAAMSLHSQVAVMGGAATLTRCRGLGAQSMLLEHRLRHAAAWGATVATATAAPHSTSSRNLTRAGFSLYMRRSWSRTPTSAAVPV
jgi:hypothetical protein